MRAGAGEPPEGSLACGPGEGSPDLAPVIVRKYAHVSNRPSLARSVAPSTGVEPPVPSTSALMIRGDTPRLSTLIPRNEPFTSPRSRLPARARLIVAGTPRWRGETPS
jgi:hypothetical protein